MDRDRRGQFRSALTGLVIGVLVMASVPVVAKNGDPLVLGASNKAGRSTWLASRGPSVLKLTNTGGNPALHLKTAAGVAPMTVESDALVQSLNADLLDGRDSGEYADALHFHVIGVVDLSWADEEIEVPLDPSTVTALDATFTNKDECGDGSTLHRYLAESSGYIQRYSGPAGTTLAWASLTLDSTTFAYNASTRSSYLQGSAPVASEWNLATHGLFENVPVGMHTVRLLLKHETAGYGVRMQAGTLVVTDLGYSCSS